MNLCTNLCSFVDLENCKDKYVTTPGRGGQNSPTNLYSFVDLQIYKTALTNFCSFVDL